MIDSSSLSEKELYSLKCVHDGFMLKYLEKKSKGKEREKIIKKSNFQQCRWRRLLYYNRNHFLFVEGNMNACGKWKKKREINEYTKIENGLHVLSNFLRDKFYIKPFKDTYKYNLNVYVYIYYYSDNKYWTSMLETVLNAKKTLFEFVVYYSFIINLFLFL